MADTLLRTFDDFDTAQRTRSALIGAGLPADAVQLRPPEDDGGPVAGNFIVDLEEKPTPPLRDASRQSAQSELRTPVQRSSCLLTVEVADERQAMLATDILDRMASCDRDDRMDSRHPPP